MSNIEEVAKIELNPLTQQLEVKVDRFVTTKEEHGLEKPKVPSLDITKEGIVSFN